MKAKSILKPILSGVIILSLSACNSDNGGADSQQDSTMAVTNIEDEGISLQRVFYSLPSPIESAMILKGAGASYNSSFMNDIKKVSNYNTTNSKALNLGIYGTDLAYATVFEQKQEISQYLKTTNSLAEGLGISGTFGESIYNRLEKNLDNQDSLYKIISEAYLITDSYLKENSMTGTSAMILTGGWIEGMHIAGEIEKNAPNSAIRDRIAEQRVSLKNLIKMLEGGEQSEEATVILADLRELKEYFDKCEVVAAEAASGTEGGVTTIGGGKKIKLSDELFNNIRHKIESLRNKII